MTKHTLKTTRTKPWSMADKSDDTWIVAKSGKIVIDPMSPEPDKVGIVDNSNATGNRIAMNGKINLASWDPVSSDLTRGIAISGDDATISIGATGRIKAGIGIYSTSDAENLSVKNAGSIIATNAAQFNSDNVTFVNQGRVMGIFGGVEIVGDDSLIANNGLIFAADTITVEGNHNRVVNGAHGVIQGDDGIDFDTIAGQSNSGVNRGVIDGTQSSLSDGAGNLTFKNFGWMNGYVELGDGNDIFNTARGVFTDSLYGGGGNDIFILSSAKAEIFEYAGEGNDTVKIASNYTLGDYVENLTLLGKGKFSGTGNGQDNIITGNKGNNSLFGEDGNDRLNGRAGNDKLTGGAGFDAFVFTKGAGKDHVIDFKDGEDYVEISGFAGITSFPELDNHISEAADGDVVINFGDGDVLRLTGVEITKIDIFDFDFV